MNIEIISTSFELEVYGFSGIAINKDYTGTVFKLMDKMWQTVKVNKLENKGQNIWVYEENDTVFAGVQLSNTPDSETGLEKKTLRLHKYAYYKHTGSYILIKRVGQFMREEIKNRGFEITSPYIEIYGHWTNDETKLETELFMCLK